MSTAEQIKVIHTLKSRAGLEDDDYRAMLGRHGVASSRQLLGTQAEQLIREMRKLPGADRPRPSAVRATGRYAPVLQSLWIAGYNLGVIAVRTDRAMMHWVERQTDLPHTRFLVVQEDAVAAIDALKLWIARDGGVVWPRTVILADRQRAVCEAIVRRLERLGSASPPLEACGRAIGLPVTLHLYRDEHWMTLANALGKRLRAALAAQARKTRKPEVSHA